MINLYSQSDEGEKKRYELPVSENFSADCTGTKRLMREYYEWFYANKIGNLRWNGEIP